MKCYPKAGPRAKTIDSRLRAQGEQPVPRNLEIKVKVASLAPFRRRIAAAPGCERAAVLRQADHYLRVARGYLKLRVVRGGASELIFYERPKRKGARESRYVTWRVEDPDTALRVLSAALGVETVVRKTREVYLVDGARIHLDRVAGLGTFIEIEVLMERAGRGSARLMGELCARLQLPARSTPGSYRDLLRRAR
jgi:predicted adenylyl cyclase CyaB